VPASLIGVFVPQETDALFSFHFNRCWVQHLIKVYHNLDEFVASRHDRKIACFQMPYPVQDTFEPMVRGLEAHCDQVLVLMAELHDNTVKFIQRNDQPYISYFICGELNFTTQYSRIHKFYDWFTTTVHFYKNERPMLLNNSLHPYEIKPQYFDALLGRKKPHRDIAFDRIDHQSNVVTYLNDYHNNDFTDPAKWKWESTGLVITRPVEWTVERVNYHGYNMSLSQIIPLEVYNQTAYSVIAETNFSNHYSFYTEKTVKPILGRRLFVSLSGQYALKNLRALGFKTFDNVLDESYDEIEDFRDRSNAVMDQVAQLSKQDQADILEQIRPICDHNYSHMMRTPWYDAYFMPAFVSYFNQ
jgi:hypothetical protein